jgi:hypothetical protein
MPYVVTAVVVAVDESHDLRFEIAGQKSNFPTKMRFLRGLMLALDFALGHRMIGCATKVF